MDSMPIHSKNLVTLRRCNSALFRDFHVTFIVIPKSFSFMVLLRTIAGYSLRGNHQCVCVICMKYRTIVFNYYHYQPGSNNIIVYGKHITHARTHTHTLARAHKPTRPPPHHPGCRCYMGGVRPTLTKIRPLFACSAGHEWPVGASLK